MLESVPHIYEVSADSSIYFNSLPIFLKELKKRRVCGNIYMYVQKHTLNFVYGYKNEEFCYF